MKKLLIILLASIFIVGCGGNDEDGANESEGNDNEQTEENSEEADAQPKDENKDVYQMGETAQTTSSSYGFPYEVTANDVTISKEIEGKAIEEFFSETSEPDENDHIMAINVTMENTGEDSFVPIDTMSPIIVGGLISEHADIIGFSDWEQEVEPGQKIEGNLVFIVTDVYEQEVLHLTFNIHDPNTETKIEIPVPEA